jgi:hypothetical protein
MPWLFYLQGKSPQYKLNRKLGGPQSRSGNGGKEIKSLSLPGIEHFIQTIAHSLY